MNSVLYKIVMISKLEYFLISITPKLVTGTSQELLNGLNMYILLKLMIFSIQCSIIFFVFSLFSGFIITPKMKRAAIALFNTTSEPISKKHPPKKNYGKD